MEVPPDTQLVIGIYLADRHPLVIRPDRSELPVRKARARRRETAPDTGVIAVGGTRFPGLVGNFMVILDVPSLSLIYFELHKIRRTLRGA